jgi:hypothetical protein
LTEVCHAVESARMRVGDIRTISESRTNEVAAFKLVAVVSFFTPTKSE